MIAGRDNGMDISQDDIDKLLQNTLAGGGDDGGEPAKAEEPAATEPDYSGVASQDDIDALFAAVGEDVGDSAPAAPAPDPAPAAAPEPAEPEIDLGGVASQDDIDSLFAAVGTPDPAPAQEPKPAAAPAPEPAVEPEMDLGGVANQDDIDALFSAAGGIADPEPAPDPEPEIVDDPGAPVGQDDIDSLFAAQSPDAEEINPVDVDMPQADAGADTTDLDELLSSISTENEAANEAAETDTTIMDDFDMEELLRQVSDAAPPPPPPPQAAASGVDEMAETAVLSPDVSAALAQNQMNDLALDPDQPAAPESPAPAAAAPAPAAPAPTPAPASADVMQAYQSPAPAPMPGPPAYAGPAPTTTPRREYSVLYGAGDIESVSNQINALLTSMAEKAHGYMQSWIAADSEAKELRSRALEEERRRTSLESEKTALARQVDDLRSRLGELEGGKVATEEAKRTLETSYQAKIRELESRVGMLSSEAETLKDELTRARNQATGVDIESRRVRFELDRLKNEVESERMERLRIQRALENREKEIQALQSQQGGQASSLFIDELHRLVRRLESELDARSSGAHEALRQLDKIEVAENMVPVAANIRASLMQALGQDNDADDALKSLGREASGVRGGAAIAPEKAEMISFESALSTYNLIGAVDIAGALLREATATPAALMRKIYQCPALRRPEVADHLSDLSRLLEGLRTVQEANDRSRGVESGDSEIFYVHMFDFLHNLVRLKLINRMSGDIWRVFLDLRGRFSFVTSDKQWAEYRDKTLKS